MKFETIRFAAKSGIGRIRLDRPERRNALNMTMVRELQAAVEAVAADPELRVVLIEGDGAAFCAGQDLKEPEAPEFVPELNRLLFRIEALAKPSIAAIGGWCLAGGLELAIACDLRVASEEARIGDYHSRINSLGGAGALARLPRLIGVSATKALFFTGDVLSGRQALSIGLVNEVHPAADYRSAARSLAARIADKHPTVIARAKEGLAASAGLPLDRAVEMTRAMQRQIVEELRVDFVGDYAGRRS